MKRFFFLTPVICVLVIGLVGAGSVQAAPEQIFNKNMAFIVPCDGDSGQKNIKEKKQNKASAKKNKCAKKTKKAKTKDSISVSKIRTDIKVILNKEQLNQQPTDLWLARDFPDKYRRLTYGEQLDEQTLRVLESAYNYVGAPYHYGGTTPRGFDCSGFIRYVFRQNGIELGRTSREQAREGTPIQLSELRPGDLIFFNMHRRSQSRINHVGIYVGNGQFIHAPSKHSREIKVENLDSTNFLPRIVEARRVID